MVSDQVISLRSLPHEGRCQLRCPVHRGVIEKQPLRGNNFITSLIHNNLRDNKSLVL